MTSINYCVLTCEIRELVMEAILWSGDALEESSALDGGKIEFKGEGAPEFDSPPLGLTNENALPTCRMTSDPSSLSDWNNDKNNKYKLL